MSFTGRTAVVTGGSRGIGRAICLELARRGANVVFSYAGNTAAAEATRKELEALGVQTRAVQGSVADPAAVKTLIDTAVKELGSLDLDGDVLSMSASGRYVAVLFADRLVIYNKNLKEYATLQGVSSAGDVLMRSDGSAVLAGSAAASVFLP